ncbi:TPA: hypothetical protein L9Y51_000521 [Klebsiella pneumoniae]|uniref:hypothetical protein n=1 Tax=Klebsiella pneumoniae TaxID=573 RepID=UPI001419F0CF|nr:hypothetical protein [Klebsiella pneumoniae]NIA83411.1 hypothetical protein [Klebsiella pneumoniae]CAE7679753.1 hypothetical protein AI2779V1_3688 [Klebsiella pneumoniae]CAE7772350.1 hypothetical protein AI2793V1_3790 [Klebsiella pneumoniae]CAH3843716.1 hypothetical protein AI2793V1_3790 [Klebsiella pneumoniae]CAH3893957.1 hypothetical protein AI2779V1_3688 [Klebsiella pneumoniae]
MTITLQTVNELIQSLESAGELSIREQKFLKLAKAFKQLAADRDAVVAENAALKSAVDHTIEWIESTNGDPCDVVILKGIRTPATDRIVAGIKADGVEMVLDLIGHTKGMLYADSVKEMLSDVSSKLREGADK